MIEVMNLSIKRGFTLIELLVVITIIGILVAVVFPNFSESRDEARNRGLQAEIKEMQLSIELYKSQFGRYPAEGACGGDSQACGGQGYIANFTDFMYPAPTHEDSANSNCNVVYQTDTNGTWYKLTAVRCHAGADNAADGIQPDEQLARCPATCATCAGAAYDETVEAFYESYAVYSAGGTCE
jgi:prepilin-type N-terminal cleavage/methylation domain-containing protein